MEKEILIWTETEKGRRWRCMIYTQVEKLPPVFGSPGGLLGEVVKRGRRHQYFFYQKKGGRFVTHSSGYKDSRNEAMAEIHTKYEREPVEVALDAKD